MPPRLIPVARPIILCDDVLRNPEKGNVHVMNVFNAIRPRAWLVWPGVRPSS